LFSGNRSGVVAIKEWKPASNLELLKEMQSSGTLSTHICNLVNDMLDDFTRPIDKEVSIDMITEKLISFNFEKSAVKRIN
jgi:hypothetical protein